MAPTGAFFVIMPYMTPTQDYVLIKPDEAEVQTKSGLFLTEEWASVPPTGVVISCGPDADVKPGEHICYLRFAALAFNVENGSQQLVRQKHIVGILHAD